MIKVFIVEDHTVVVEGIYTLLQSESDIEVIGYAHNAAGCLQQLSMLTPDVIVMDINLPDMTGIDLCKKVRDLRPEITVIALSTFTEGSYIRKMMESGAAGYLLKNSGKKEIVDAIRLVASGKKHLSFEAFQNLKSETQKLKDVPPLTKREKDVLALVVEGLSNIQIGKKLFISPDTVDSHRKNLHLKLGVNNTASLVRFALENGLLSL